MPLSEPCRNSLVAKTEADLRRFFELKHHAPSQPMWHSLGTTISVLGGMAEGSLAPAVYLSSLDPGVGKTRAVVHFVRALLADSEYVHVGVIICVSLLAEVRRYVDEIGLAKGQFGVLTSDKELNRLGISDIEKARVLFTTHRQVEIRCLGKSFAEVAAFAYWDRPRQVRIWDESILPGQTLTLTRDELASLLLPLRLRAPKVADWIDRELGELTSLPDGGQLHIPDFEGEFGVDMNTVLGLVEQETNQTKDRVAMLWSLAGKVVTVRREYPSGTTLLDFRDTLPPDLGPVLVLDASGRVRTTYEQWEKHRGGIVKLPSASKSYRNLTLHVWNRGGGKGSFRRAGEGLVEGVASTINTKPREEWLVVHHKDGIGMDFESAVRDRLWFDNKKVHFLNWGSHHATNDFAHVPNVILAGTLFYPMSHYEALGRLSSGYPSSRGEFPEGWRAQIQRGEHAHLILQALCRGSVRRCHGDACAPCDAYVIASLSSGIREALPIIFPGCKIVDWVPVPKALKGLVGHAVAVVKDHFKDPSNTYLAFSKLRRTICVTDSANFRKNIRQHPDFQDAIAALGIAEYGQGSRKTGFMRAAESWGFKQELTLADF